MPKQQIVLEIGLDGSVKVETSGFKGKQCYDATKLLKLGRTVTDEKKKEYYEDEEIPRIRQIGR